ncbi:MAG: hypothetical protein KF791_20635 [Verrucomicrobiae bacterium]|nr:hypothetical protein [Verrucomicrobiae bacterium]
MTPAHAAGQFWLMATSGRAGRDRRRFDSAEQVGRKLVQVFAPLVPGVGAVRFLVDHDELVALQHLDRLAGALDQKGDLVIGGHLGRGDWRRPVGPLGGDGHGRGEYREP